MQLRTFTTAILLTASTLAVKTFASLPSSSTVNLTQTAVELTTTQAMAVGTPELEVGSRFLSR
jgi:hypothetical protein